MCWGEGGRDTWSHCNGVGEKGEGTHGHIAMVLGRRGKGHMVTLQWCWGEGGRDTWSHCNGVGEKGEGTHGHIAMVLGVKSHQMDQLFP